MVDERSDEQRAVDADLGRDWRLLHTSGEGCHWCGAPAAFVWCPWGTHVCQHCHDLTMAGEEWHVAEKVAARMTVRGNEALGGIELEGFRARERALVDRWIEGRSHAHPIGGDPVHDPRDVATYTD
jgi:hypothetical protein